VRGEEILRAKVPSLKIEYNADIRIPEVITPDMWRSDVERLTAPSDMKRSEILRNFVKQNNNLIGVNDVQADNLKVTADYTNPNGEISFAHLEQTINGIPVFRGEIKAGFTKSGEMIRVINNLAPGLDYDSVSSDFRDPLDAVKAAYRHINSEPTKLDTQINESLSTDSKAVFGNGDWSTVAE
jgi:Zn-dependent metalloprotease